MDHTYFTPTENYFTIDQQYADDIGFISTGKHLLKKTEKELPIILKKRNLFINQQKTENYEIFNHCHDNWKNCKYLGSFLDTEKDFERRKYLTNNSFANLKTTLNQRRYPQVSN